MAAEADKTLDTIVITGLDRRWQVLSMSTGARDWQRLVIFNSELGRFDVGFRAVRPGRSVWRAVRIGWARRCFERGIPFCINEAISDGEQFFLVNLVLLVWIGGA